MEMSEKIDELAKALNKLQKNKLEVIKTAENPAYKRNGEASKYAVLEESWALIRKYLTDLGLSVAQFPSVLNDKPALTTIVMHESGQWIKDTGYLLPQGNDPQKLVAAITYMRRAAFNAALGIVAVGEDDDGNTASGVDIVRTTNPGDVPAVGMHKGKRVADLNQRERDESIKYWRDAKPPLPAHVKAFVEACEQIQEKNNFNDWDPPNN